MDGQMEGWGLGQWLVSNARMACRVRTLKRLHNVKGRKEGRKGKELIPEARVENEWLEDKEYVVNSEFEMGDLKCKMVCGCAGHRDRSGAPSLVNCD